MHAEPIEASTPGKRSFSIRVTALVFIFTTALMFIGLLGLTSYTYRYAMETRDMVSDRHVTQLRAAEELRYMYLQYEQSWKDILLRGHNPQSYHTNLGNFYELERRIQTAIEDLARAISPDNPSIQALNAFEHDFFQVGRLYRRALRTYNEDISDPQFAADAVTYNSINDPVSRNSELIEALEIFRQNSYRHISAEMQNFEITIVMAMLFLICGFLLSIYYLSNRFIISPINKGITLAENISRGELENHIKVENASSEVITLLQSLKRMQANISHARQELISAKEQAEQSNQAKSAFLSRMSHELRTPLHAILGLGQIMLLKPDNLSSQQQSNVKKIMKAGQHLLDLINDILDLARIENHKLDIHIEDVELSDVISECISLTGPLAQQKSVSLINRVPAGQYLVRGDFLRIKQALINLVSNAIKYGPERGDVILSCHSTADNALRIEITDTGPGIPMKEQHLLFKPFERLDSTRFVEGTGIGLALTKQLVELMHGKVGVNSLPGKGSTFWILLPLSTTARIDDQVSTRKQAQSC